MRDIDLLSFERSSGVFIRGIRASGQNLSGKNKVGGFLAAVSLKRRSGDRRSLIAVARKND
jgi:hypothetical protein